jgi:hypothetical protein
MTKEEFRSRVFDLELGGLTAEQFHNALYALVREFLRT